MNIPNDGGWGKSEGLRGEGRTSHIGGISGILALFPRDWLTWGSLALAALLCFGIGLLAARQDQPSKEPLWIEQLPASELPGSAATGTAEGKGMGQESKPDTVSAMKSQTAPESLPAAAAAALPQSGQYVASKTGSKYYLTSCAGAKRIKDENRVYFATKAQAEAKGYSPSSTCKGM